MNSLLTDTYIQLPIDMIHVKRDERQRRELIVDDLKKSIARVGLIHPIVVKEDGGRFILVTGERRYTACKELGWKEIPGRFANTLNPIEAQLIELEENVKRKDLTWQDQVKAVCRLHELHVQLNPKWKQGETAEALSMTDGTISLYLKINNYIEDPRILECKTARQAYEVIDRRESRRKAVELSNLFDEADDSDPFAVDIPADGDDLGEDIYIDENGDEVKESALPTPTTSSPTPKVVPAAPKSKISQDILHADFFEWAPQYSGPRFNFLHIDFPYGNTEIGPQMRGNEHTYYDDNPKLYMDLIGCLCANLDNFFAEFGWCMFWYSIRMHRPTLDYFKYQAPSLNVQHQPLIWVHSDNSGISPDHRHRPRHIYDTALIMSRGDVPIVKVKSDAYASPTDHKLHPSTKPVPMLKHFFEMFVDEHTTVFDPTCGSGAALRAAEALGANRVLGIEADWERCEIARKALQDSRKLASLSEQDIWEEAPAA